MLFRSICPSLPILAHPCPSLPILAHPCPYLPILAHSYPSLPILASPILALICTSLPYVKKKKHAPLFRACDTTGKGQTLTLKGGLASCQMVNNRSGLVGSQPQRSGLKIITAQRGCEPLTAVPPYSLSLSLVR